MSEFDKYTADYFKNLANQAQEKEYKEEAYKKFLLKLKRYLLSALEIRCRQGFYEFCVDLEHIATVFTKETYIQSQNIGVLKSVLENEVGPFLKEKGLSCEFVSFHPEICYCYQPSPYLKTGPGCRVLFCLYVEGDDERRARVEKISKNFFDKNKNHNK